jgi:LAGLIDADG endonuclease
MFQLKQFHVKRLLDPWYVTGFVDGCGSFTYSRSGSLITVYFALKVGATDAPILHEIQAFFGGAGRVYATRSGSDDLEMRGAYYRVTRSRELALVAAHFDRYPLAGSKARVFGIWREMVAAKQRFRRPDRERLSKLAQHLSAFAKPTPS